MAEQFPKPQNKAQEYQNINRQRIHKGLHEQRKRVENKLQIDNNYAIRSDYDIEEDFQEMVEHLQNAELISNILEPVYNNIYFIKAGTGSGKTHAVLDAINKGIIDAHPEGKAVISTPTRAMAMDIQNTGNMRVSDEDFVGLWIGGENGKNIDQEDKAVAVTGGKLWDLMMVDPTLGTFLDEHTSRKTNRGLNQVNTLIIDEADAIDSRLIPAIKWLSQVRPDLKIIFVSATLNVDEFRNIYQPHPEAAHIAPDQERPRPIESKYVSNKTVEAIGLSGFLKASIYTNAPTYVLDSWIYGNDSHAVLQNKFRKIEIENTHPPLVADESVIIFMPTISSVERLSTIIKQKYGSKVEVRALHSKLPFDEMDKRLYDDLPKDKIGIFVCTDIVGRGVNFPDKFNINRAIDSGLRNRPRYDPITGREVLKVDKATQSDVAQSLGRAGRNSEDTRDVLGYVLQPQSELSHTMTNQMISNDPTHLILESAAFLKKIQNLNDIPDQYKPTSLIQYLKALDTNPQTSKEFEAKLEFSLNRLYGIQALDKDNNLTKFGEFLVKMRLPVDYGIMLFESLNSPYLPQIIRLINLIDDLEFFVTRDYEMRANYTKLVELFKTVFPDITSDLEFYSKLLELSGPYIDKTGTKKIPPSKQIIKKGEDGKNPVTQQVDSLIKEQKIDELFKYIFTYDLGEHIGINLETIVNAYQNEERVYKNLDDVKIAYGNTLISQTTYKETLKQLSLYALPATIMEYQYTDRRGFGVYKHLPTSNNVLVSQESQMLIGNEPKYLTCTSVRLDTRMGEVYYASGVQPVTLTDLINADKYTNWIVRKDPMTLTSHQFNPDQGEGLAVKNIVFQDYAHHSTKILESEIYPINTESEPTMINILLKEYIRNNIKKLDKYYNENELAVNYYSEISTLSQFEDNALSLTTIPSLILTQHYDSILNQSQFNTIYTLDQFQAILDSNPSLFKLDIKNYLTEADFEIISKLEIKYPHNIFGYEINYGVKIDEIKAYINDDKDFLYNLVRDGDLEKIEKELGSNLYIKRGNIPAYYSTVAEIVDIYIQSDLNSIQESGSKKLNLPSFDKILTQNDLDKIKPQVFGTHPITGEELTYYPHISQSLWGNKNIVWSLYISDITSDPLYQILLDNVKSEVDFNNLKTNFEAEIQNAEGIMQILKTNLEKSNESAKYVELETEFNEIKASGRENITKSTQLVLKQINKAYQEMSQYNYFGDEAIQKFNEQLELAKQLYPEGQTFEEYELEDSRSYTPLEIKIDDQVVFKVELRYNRDSGKHFLDYDYTYYFDRFEKNPKCKEVTSQVRTFRKSDAEMSEYNRSRENASIDLAEIQARENVKLGAWKYGRFVVDKQKKAKLAETIIKQISTKINLDDIQKKEIRKFISDDNNAVYVPDTFEEFYNARTKEWELRLEIVKLSSNGLQPEPKTEYYFNVLIGKDGNLDGTKKITEKLLASSQTHTVTLISGDVELQPPYPIPQNLPLEEDPTAIETEVDQAQLEALANLFGGSNKKKNKKR